MNGGALRIALHPPLSCTERWRRCAVDRVNRILLVIAILLCFVGVLFFRQSLTLGVSSAVNNVRSPLGLGSSSSTPTPVPIAPSPSSVDPSPTIALLTTMHPASASTQPTPH